MDVSFQLYSARNFTPWEGVLDQLTALGYTQVEGFGGVYQDAPAFRAALDARGLSMPSGHFFPLASFEEDFDKSIAAARALGMAQIYCPAPDDIYREGADAAAWRDLAARLETAAKRVQDAGLRFGWHNHHWEFMPLPTGEIPMALLLEGAPSMEWEADIAWIVRGGGDPLAWIKDHATRITAAHVKDIAPAGEAEDEDGWADVGHGTMDWPAITAALRAAGVSLFVMEHDNPNDLARFARRSITSFRQF
ncbi:sugar phosphate isomerase/epimerase family protein [Roseinatronobacter alkalisoli]|uniref:Sugar phosphate isomerase/epimerase n=1 Tax=Roseinatronobacter alkalisoli TaxID=3028235 RepID=A0ABT5TCY0_9RHOB|nr:sugar phosphate isomerase/epimerase [Roseinatronobacter sp. HJB301]MDD7972211.1 sugar phosphate isomerase/epimerase [Roseinatronobacter sp. HJB301]